jgi:hypothetical protein
MHLLEFFAFRKASELAPHGDLFLVDNTVVIDSFVKGHSPMPNIDTHIRQQLNFRASLAYVPSKKNLADAPSRNVDSSHLPVNFDEVDALISQLKVRWVDWTYVQ